MMIYGIKGGPSLALSPAPLLSVRREAHFTGEEKRSGIHCLRIIMLDFMKQ